MKKYVMTAITASVIATAVLLASSAGPVLELSRALAQEVVVVTPAPDTTVNVGSAINNLILGYVAVLGSVVAAVVVWAVFKFTGIKIEANARSAIETFVTNAAGAFLVRFDTLAGVKVDVGNAQIADLANGALLRVPDALKQFGLGPEDIKKRIVEKIGILTAVSASVPTGAPPA